MFGVCVAVCSYDVGGRGLYSEVACSIAFALFLASRRKGTTHRISILTLRRKGCGSIVRGPSQMNVYVRCVCVCLFLCARAMWVAVGATVIGTPALPLLSP